MSLREEIKVLVTSALCRQIDVRDSESDFYTDEILSKLEKRIESLRKKEEHNSYDMGWNLSLEKVKELLK